MCQALNETILHLFLHCSVALEVWKCLTQPYLDVYGMIFGVDTLVDWLKLWPIRGIQSFGRLVWKLLPYGVFWILWKTRNTKIFDNQEVKVEKICSEIKATVWYWCACSAHRRNFNFRDLIVSWNAIIKGDFVFDPG
ncbi:Reverse transcriptase zinc-binding domain [Thalictrum thalictroides]|uniref:Reverse transcriptase zinc-binding domain n=1 Tax=Thalictrum thalictroides TaxID=46969 RepID=A0A7J6WLC4_THATH|nr:Reverse transcriptase zinc-binding domain [Thalictrum thalictroides]